MSQSSSQEGRHAALPDQLREIPLYQARVFARRLILTVVQRVYDAFLEISWLHVMYKTAALGWVMFIMWLCVAIWTLSGDFRDLQLTEDTRVSFAHHHDLVNYFANFKGLSECSLSSSDLYSAPTQCDFGLLAPDAFCSNRKAVLHAMSTGGRVGFDAPYTPAGCHYRWFSVAEIGIILDRFDSVVFIGDSTLQTVYSGLNILLRQDLMYGALKTWELEPEDVEGCKCSNQFVRETCSEHLITDSEEVGRNIQGKHFTTSTCQRTPHALLSIQKYPAPDDVLARFHSLVRPAPRSNYKAIPIIHSLTTSHSVTDASASLTEFLALADATKRKTPMLWLGPGAAGHIEFKHRAGNQEIWQFAMQMDKIAREKDVETLGLWNLTVQASSFDGMRFDERVGIVGAMMVLNWISRLDST